MTNRSGVAALAAAVLSMSAFAQDTALGDPATSEDTKKQLTMGDLPFNAFTKKAGTLLIRPLFPSTYAISDNFEVGTAVLGLLGGPNLGVEFAVMSSDNMAFSLSPGLSGSWNFANYGGALDAAFSFRGGPGFLTVQAGAGYARRASYTYIDSTGATITVPEFNGLTGVPVRLYYDIPAGTDTIWNFYVGGDAYGLATSPLKGGFFGFNWYHAFGGFHLGLGIFVPFGIIPKEVTDGLKAIGVTLPAFAALPLPDVTLGWKF